MRGLSPSMRQIPFAQGICRVFTCRQCLQPQHKKSRKEVDVLEVVFTNIWYVSTLRFLFHLSSSFQSASVIIPFAISWHGSPPSPTSLESGCVPASSRVMEGGFRNLPLTFSNKWKTITHLKQNSQFGHLPHEIRRKQIEPFTIPPLFFEFWRLYLFRKKVGLRERLVYSLQLQRCLRTPPWILNDLLQTAKQLYWLVVSTHLKNISQMGNLPQTGVKIKNIWNHHPVYSEAKKFMKFPKLTHRVTLKVLQVLLTVREIRATPDSIKNWMGPYQRTPQ